MALSGLVALVLWWMVRPATQVLLGALTTAGMPVAKALAVSAVMPAARPGVAVVLALTAAQAAVTPVTMAVMGRSLFRLPPRRETARHTEGVR